MTEETNTPYIFDFVEETEKTLEEVQSEEDSDPAKGNFPAAENILIKLILSAFA